MTSKKAIAVVAGSIAAACIAVGSVVYFRYWQEPRAYYAETDNPKLIRIRQELDELKAELRSQGLYNCCIRNDCDWCALYMGHCPCAELVSRKGEELSCPECAAAWNKKQGKIAGVDPDAIRVTTFGVYGYGDETGHDHPAANEVKHPEQGDQAHEQPGSRGDENAAPSHEHDNDAGDLH